MTVKNKCLHDSWVLFNSSVFMFCYVFTGQNGAITLMNSHSNIYNLTRSFSYPENKCRGKRCFLRVIIDCTKIQVTIVQSNSNNSQKKSHLMQLIHTILAPLCKPKPKTRRRNILRFCTPVHTANVLYVVFTDVRLWPKSTNNTKWF